MTHGPIRWSVDELTFFNNRLLLLALSPEVWFRGFYGKIIISHGRHHLPMTA